MTNPFGGLYCFGNVTEQPDVLTETTLQRFTHATPSFGVSPDIKTSIIQVDEPGFYIVTACLTIVVNKNNVLLKAFFTHNNETTNFVCINEFDIQMPHLFALIAPINFKAGDTCSLKVSASKEVDMVLLSGQFIMQFQDIPSILRLD